MNYFMQCGFVRLNLTGNNKLSHVTYCYFAFMARHFFFLNLLKNSSVVVYAYSIIKERKRWDECSSGDIYLFSSDNREACRSQL